jgi:hypothetical protein
MINVIANGELMAGFTGCGDRGPLGVPVWGYAAKAHTEKLLAVAEYYVVYYVVVESVHFISPFGHLIFIGSHNRENATG